MENLFLTTAFGLVVSSLVQWGKGFGFSPRVILVFMAIVLGSLYASFQTFVEESSRLKVEEFVLLCLGQASLIYGFVFKFFEKERPNE